MTDELRSRLRDLLDRSAGNYRQLGARDLGAYLAGDPKREDEEILAEPLFRHLLEGLLNFRTMPTGFGAEPSDVWRDGTACACARVLRSEEQRR